MAAASEPDSLAPEVVEPLLRGRFGHPYRYADEAETTQAMLQPDDPEGATAVADFQTAGRGRLGRRWTAPAGSSLMTSILLRPPPSSPIAQLSLVAGLATAETVEQALDLSVQIKWPNDVMVDRRKVAGVLAEARDDVVVLGIGINVNQTAGELPADARLPVASLRTVDGVVRERAPLLADLIVRLERAYGAWLAGGLDAVFDGIGSRDFLRGRRVRVDGVEGVAGGLDRRGRLLVGGHPVESGEVQLVR
ncbi:MAG TPA: biotin--[acetyl-CoA-carboxylase] ligase [Gaiellaceae bacterium]|nr:biotin--[acetyl-CoA-carboxylase] ligase [Gaiellaceae bacterium]